MAETSRSVIIDSRFCGPKSSANGGYTAGLFAKVVGGAAEVTLKAPPPLDTPIKLRKTQDGAWQAVCGETVIATVRPGAVEIDPPPLPDGEAIAAARERYVKDVEVTSMLPYCFVCGVKREPGDGLRIFCGPAAEGPVNADFWTPAQDLAGKDGLVRAQFLWAALDCPSFFALRTGTSLGLLGRLTVDIKRRPAPGERLIAASWRTGREGRKHFSASALYDQKRDMIAAANAVWIELNDPAFLARLKAENA